MLLLFHLLILYLPLFEKDPYPRPFFAFWLERSIGHSFEAISKWSKETHQNRFPCPLIFLVDCSCWVPFFCPRWWYLFETVSLEYNISHFAFQVCFRKFVVLSLPACGRLPVFLHRIVDITTCFSRRLLFRIARIVWRMELFWYPSNWTLFSSMSWTEIWILPPRNRSCCLDSFYAPSYYFLVQRMLSYCSLFIFCVSNICSDYLEHHFFKQKKSLFQEILQLVVVLFLAEFIVFVIVYL